MLKDYDVDILYHPRKASVVEDAHSRKSTGSLTVVQPERRDMVWEIQRLSSLGVRLANSEDSGVFIREVAESSIIDEVKRHQYKDPILAQYRDQLFKRKRPHLRLHLMECYDMKADCVYPILRGYDGRLWERHTLPVILFTQGQRKCIMT